MAHLMYWVYVGVTSRGTSDVLSVCRCYILWHISCIGCMSVLHLVAHLMYWVYVGVTSCGTSDVLGVCRCYISWHIWCIECM